MDTVKCNIYLRECPYFRHLLFIKCPQTQAVHKFMFLFQIPFELGMVIERPLGNFVVPLTIVEIWRHITETNICAVTVSLISIAFLVIIKVNDKKYV